MQTLSITFRDSLFTISERRKQSSVLYSQVMEDLGYKLRKAREDSKLDRREVMERMGHGNKSTSRLANYELGDREPTLADLTKLAAIYGMSLIELLQYKDPEPLIRLSGNLKAMFDIWQSMEPEEQDLWLQRGRKILATREGDEAKALPAGKNATRMPHK